MMMIILIASLLLGELLRFVPDLLRLDSMCVRMYGEGREGRGEKRAPLPPPSDNWGLWEAKEKLEHLGGPADDAMRGA